MFAQPKLHMSPFVLTAVMYDNTNSYGDQEGFLIGHAEKTIRREISDQSMSTTEEDLKISIYSCIPCGSFKSFYDHLGNLNESVIEDFLDDRKDSVIGWFRYRRNLVAFPSSREMIVHKNLKKFFHGNIPFGDEHFVLGVFGSACYPTAATHTYDYAFFSSRMDSSFRSLTIKLLNLGDTKTEYRTTSLSGSYIKSTTYDSVINIPWDFSSCWQTEDAVQSMQRMLREKCDNLVEELIASESVNSRLEEEVTELTKELEALLAQENTESTSTEPIAENFPPEKVLLPLSESHTKVHGKRNLTDMIDVSEESHPVYGKYFPQNHPQEPGCSYHFSGEISGMNYNFLPPKKKIKVLLQERRRIMDHDYDNVSDEDPPHQFLPETDEDSSDTYETGYLSSDAAGCMQDEENQQDEDSETATEISSASTSTDKVSKDTPPHIKVEEAKVRVVFMENITNVPFQSENEASESGLVCPESVNEEIVETTDVSESNLRPPIGSFSNLSNEDIPKSDSEKDKQSMEQEFEDQTTPVSSAVSTPITNPSTSVSPTTSNTYRPIVIFCKPVKKDEPSTH